MYKTDRQTAQRIGTCNSLTYCGESVAPRLSCPGMFCNVAAVSARYTKQNRAISPSYDKRRPAGYMYQGGQNSNAASEAETPSKGIVKSHPSQATLVFCWFEADGKSAQKLVHVSARLETLRLGARRMGCEWSKRRQIHAWTARNGESSVNITFFFCFLCLVSCWVRPLCLHEVRG